jgi:hypothetical protein
LIIAAMVVLIFAMTIGADAHLHWHHWRQWHLASVESLLSLERELRRFKRSFAAEVRLARSLAMKSFIAGAP